MSKCIKAVDLFCGGGGTSTGLVRACQELGRPVDLLAINHWDVAIATHSVNHPTARHMCQSLDEVDPRTAVSGGRLDLLVASPECVYHSRARGGRPINDQRRASAWLVLRWLEHLYVDSVLIENVPEFTQWGPLGANGLPLKSKRGQIFQCFVSAMESLGYRVSWRILNCADYGDPTTRQRLFLIGRRGRKPLCWPEPTHAETEESTLFGKLPRWRPAREIIDWSLKGKSIFDRKRPLSDKTLARIRAGLERFGGKAFLVPNFGERTTQQPRTHSLDAPLPAVTSHGAGVLVEPFILGQQSGSVPRSLGSPVPTIATDGALSLVEPFLMHLTHGGRVHSMDDPVPTVTGAHRGEQAVVQPFLMQMSQSGSNGDRLRALHRPMPTITTADDLAVAEPFLVSYYGTGGPQSVGDPIDTVTARDRFGLVEVDGMQLDILFRMLQPHELAAAMSFPSGYKFSGNRADQVKQVGNAVPCATAYNLCRALLTG